MATNASKKWNLEFKLIFKVRFLILFLYRHTHIHTYVHVYDRKVIQQSLLVYILKNDCLGKKKEA